MNIYMGDWILDISEYTLTQLIELRQELETAVDLIDDRISDLEEVHHIDESQENS